MTNMPLVTILLLTWHAYNALLPVSCVAPIALASMSDVCPTLHVFLDGQEGRETSLWKCGKPLQVVLTIKSLSSSGSDDSSSPWSNLLCRNDGRDVTFLPINRTARYINLTEPCPGNERKAFTCSLSVSRRCFKTKYFAVYFVHLPETAVEILDYESLVASAAIPAFHLQNLFFPHFEWKTKKEETTAARLCSFEDRRWRWTSTSLPPSPPGATVFTAILNDKSPDDEDESLPFSPTSSGCDLSIDDPSSFISFRVKVVSQHPLTRGQELHSEWTRTRLIDLVVPNNVSSVNVTEVTSRSMSLEWFVDDAVTDWGVSVYYRIEAVSPCNKIKEETKNNKIKIEGILFPGQWYDVTVTTVLNKTLKTSPPASLRVQTSPEVPESPIILSADASFHMDADTKHRSRVDIFFYWLPPPKCSQNGDISYEILYTIDDQSLPSPFAHNSRCPPESMTCTEHYVLTIKGDKMMPRVEDNQRVALTIRSKTEAGTSDSSSTVSATVSFAALAQDRYLENFKVSRVADFSTSGLINVTWAEALRHPPPGEEEAQRRFRNIDATCNVSVVVCAYAQDHFCTGASMVTAAPADKGFVIMAHPRLGRQGEGEEEARSGVENAILETEDPLDEYKWGLAISCPDTTSTGIQWRKDKCVYEMGKPINYNAVYAVTGIAVNSTTIQLEWSSLPCSLRGEGIDGFFVIAESLIAKVEAEKKNKVRNSRPFARVHRHSVHNLLPSTSYRFTVTPYSESTGPGSKSEAVEIKTIGDEGRVIKIVVIVAIIIAVIVCCGWLQRKRSQNLKEVEDNYDKDMKMTTWYRECDEQLGTVFEDDEPDEDDAAEAAATGTTGVAASKSRPDTDDAATDDDAASDNVGISSAANRKYAKLSLGKEEESAFIPPDKKGEDKEDEKRENKAAEDLSAMGANDKEKNIIEATEKTKDTDKVSNGDAVLVETAEVNPAVGRGHYGGTEGGGGYEPDGRDVYL